MGKWAALPTWLVTRIAIQLMRKHPWHGNKFTLYDWYVKQTPLCREFDVAFYAFVALLIIFARRMGLL